MPHKYLVCISSNLLSHTLADGRPHSGTDKQTFFHILQQAARSRRRRRGSRSRHNFCHNLSWHFFATFLCLFLSLSPLLSLWRTLAIFPALTISNLIRHFVEAANHPSEQIHQNSPTQPPERPLRVPPFLLHARSNRHLAVSFARFLLHLPLPLPRLPALLPA